METFLKKNRITTNPLSCAICLEKYTEESITTKLEGCTHQFHELCISKWLAEDHSCPTCRHPVVIQEKESSASVIAVCDAVDNQHERFWIVEKEIPSNCDPKTLETDCIVCRSPMHSPCVECQCFPNKECYIIWGKCGHANHLHCRIRLRRGSIKLGRICPLDQKDWVSSAITRVDMDTNFYIDRLWI
jgi:hypothetical protein